MTSRSLILVTVLGAFTARAAAPAFAPVPPDHPLAATWNDPEFQKRLLGTYGMKPDVEPRMTPEEQAFYRDKLVPVLQTDPAAALKLLQDRAKPGASAQFDFVLGNVHFQTDDLTNAIRSFTVATEKFPDFLRAQKNLGFALLRAGQYDEAVRPLTRTVALGGADPRLYGLLGFAYLNQGRHASAQGAYQQALVLEPDNIEFKLGLVKSAIALGGFDQALALLDEVLQEHPDREALWALQANVLIQKDQPARAALSLEMLRRLDKATAAQLLLLGDLYMTQDARDLALAAYLEAVEKDPGAQLSKSLRAAEILAARGAWKESAELLARIKAAAGGALTGPEELKWLKLSARLALNQERTDEALAILDDVATRNPLDGEALLMAGDVYSRTGEPDRARMRYETAGKIEGFEAEALLKQAQLLVASRKYDSALELLRKAQKITPRDNVQRYLERVEQVARTAGRRS
ncbi:MAG: tetratricopeptide repeat protein [Verrucomicrobiae bacterium]|nr:tetratricopeptide repeat protein [Verrucomicrobiae bacterium]